jgi:hypothetical protein
MVLLILVFSPPKEMGTKNSLSYENFEEQKPLTILKIKIPTQHWQGSLRIERMGMFWG